MVNDNHARRANPVGELTTVYEPNRNPSGTRARESDLRVAPTESPDPRAIDGSVVTGAGSSALRTTGPDVDKNKNGIAVLPADPNTSALEHAGCGQRSEFLLNLRVAVLIDPSLPLGRRVLVDGVDALEHEGYRSHCRALLSTSLEYRVDYLKRASGDHRRRIPDAEFIRADFFLGAGWLLDLHLAATRLMRRRKATPDYGFGLRICKAIRKAREIYRVGERGCGAGAK